MLTLFCYFIKQLFNKCDLLSLMVAENIHLKVVIVHPVGNVLNILGGKILFCNYDFSLSLILC